MERFQPEGRIGVWEFGRGPQNDASIWGLFPKGRIAKSALPQLGPSMTQNDPFGFVGLTY
ncbi:MAG: hypothetical protein RL351_786, partial [Actinomycetota bacterium]